MFGEFRDGGERAASTTMVLVRLLSKLKRNGAGAVNRAAVVGNRIGVVAALVARSRGDIAVGKKGMPRFTPPLDLNVPDGSQVRPGDFLGLKRSPKNKK